MRSLLTLLPLLLASSVTALDVPDKVQTFFKNLKSKGECSNKLAGGFTNSEFDDEEDTAYCGDHLDDYGVVYLQASGGRFSNLDVDCDGAQGGPQDDGRCDDTDSTQGRTSVKAVIESYDVDISDLNPNVHSYVVFGNTGSDNDFNPQEWGMHETSVMAVVCGDQMFFGVWGDVNGGDSVGETSLALATACYGKKMSGGDGDGSSHNPEDVLYIGFTGADAVPGKDGANWDAENFDDFHDSITTLGNKLVNRIGNKDAADDIKGSLDTSQQTCSWTEHCKGATCESADDCSDDLTCSNGKCAERDS